MFNKYPYTDFNDLNLDWVIKNQIETQKKADTATETANNTKDYVDDYFNNLDLQDEVNTKIDEMNNDGTTVDLLGQATPPVIDAWLASHITNPQNPPLDASLLLSTAAARSDIVGGRFEGLYKNGFDKNTALSTSDFTTYGSNYLSEDNIIFGEIVEPTNGILYKPGYVYDGTNNYGRNDYVGHLKKRIAVTEGDAWYKSTRTPTIFYTSEGEYLSAINQNTTSFTVPEGAAYMDVDVKLTDYEDGVKVFLSRPRWAGRADFDCSMMENINNLHRRGTPGKLKRWMFSVSQPSYSSNHPSFPYKGLYHDNTVYDVPNIATDSFIYMPAGMGCRVKDIELSWSYILIYDLNHLYTGIYMATSFKYGCCFVADENCYIRLVLRLADENISPTEADYEKLIDNIEFFNSLDTPFSGKKISVLGDSISTYEGYEMLPDASAYYPVPGVLTTVDGLYLKKVCDYLGMKMWVNNSWSGRCAGSINDNNAPGGYQAAQINALAKDGIDPDIILIRLGANDFNQGEPLGTYDGTGVFPTNVDNFRGAYANILKSVCIKYPNATIYCCSMIIGDRNSTNTEFPEKVNGVLMKDYNNAIKELAELFNVKYIDQWDCGITYFNVSTYMQQQTSGSVTWYTHPNFRGHDLMARKTIAELLNNPPIN